MGSYQGLKGYNMNDKIFYEYVNVLYSGMIDENDNHVEENYWDKYCSE